MYSNKNIWKVSYPILISLFVQNLINITDTAFLGRVGEVELGASALAGVFYMAVYMIGFGFSTGSQIMMARRNGEKRYGEIGGIMQQGVFFLIVLAVIMFFATRLLSPIILKGMIHSEPVYQATMEFIDYRTYGLFFSFIAVMFRAFFVGITKTKILTINSILMAVSNIILNYILIFGKFGFPAMGIAGAAIASVLAEMISVVFYIIYIVFRVNGKKYALFNFSNFDPRVIVRILNVSIWTMVQYFVTIGTWFLFFVAIEHLGERQLAISNIVRSISTLFFMPVSAFATTSSTLVSNAIGAGRIGDVFPICRNVIKMCYIVILPLIALIYIFPEAFIRIYTDNDALMHDSIPALFVMASFYLISVPGSILFNSVSGTGNTRSAFIIETVTVLLYVAAIYYLIIYLRSDVAVCWFVEHLYWGAMLLFSYLYLKKANWQSKKI